MEPQPEYRLEVIAFNLESCLIAERAGAHRIELCDNPGEGGTTPSYGTIHIARQKTGIRLFPIIRPRGGDFLYSRDEFEIMKKDIRLCRETGCDGVVIGMLHSDGTVDKIRCSRLVDLAYPMGVTFHRAFDRVYDPYESLEDVIDIGCERILTSGGRPLAMDGAFTIAQLVKQSDSRISIMPGSGVRASNIMELLHQTGVTEFHSSARNLVPSGMEYQNPAMNENLQSILLNEDEVKQMARLLKSRSVVTNHGADGELPSMQG